MRHVCLFRAQGVPRRDAVDEVTIVIANPMPDLPADRTRAFFASEGSALAHALWTSCPVGTIDAAIAALNVRLAAQRATTARGGRR